jgi:hypothetical protein
MILCIVTLAASDTCTVASLAFTVGLFSGGIDSANCVWTDMPTENNTSVPIR